MRGASPFDVVWIVAFSVSLLIASWGAYRRWRSRRRATGWPVAEATIRSDFATQVENATLDMNTLCQIVLQYSYQVDDEFYSGCFMLAERFTSHEDAHSAARAWLDKKIFVRYNPARPEESVFLRADGAPKGSISLGNRPPDSYDLIDLALK